MEIDTNLAARGEAATCGSKGDITACQNIWHHKKSCWKKSLLIIRSCISSPSLSNTTKLSENTNRVKYELIWKHYHPLNSPTPLETYLGWAVSFGPDCHLAPVWQRSLMKIVEGGREVCPLLLLLYIPFSGNCCGSFLNITQYKRQMKI